MAAPRPQIHVPPDLADAYRRGEVAVVDVAGRLGCSWEAARRALLRAGVDLRPPGSTLGRDGPAPKLEPKAGGAAGPEERRRRRMKPYAVIADLCNTDDSLTAIAGRYGVTVPAISYVYRKCLRHGIPVRPRPPAR